MQTEKKEETQQTTMDLDFEEASKEAEKGK